MNLRTSAFCSDVLSLTRDDLLALLRGETLRKGAMVVRCMADDADPNGTESCGCEAKRA